MTEDQIDDLIAVLWPLLDKGVTQEQIMDGVYTVLGAWTPE